MSTINDSDYFIVERSGTQYKVSAENLMSTIEDTDLMIIARGNSQYKVTCADVRDQLGDSGFTCEFLVIGGGGFPGSSTWIGGSDFVSGGGAGGYISSVVGEQSGGGLSAQLPIIMKKGDTTYNVTVGAPGSNSRFSGTVEQGSFDYTAFAGGDGGGEVDGPGDGFTGASGGGGGQAKGDLQGVEGVVSLGGAGIQGQGFAGANGKPTDNNACANTTFWTSPTCYNTMNGGGGGAGSAGNGVNGGNGVQSNITGTPTYYAGGGSGENINSYDAVNYPVTPGLGHDNFGGGGGSAATAGAGNITTTTPQGGAVILRYTSEVTLQATGLTVSTTSLGGSKVSVISAGSGTVKFV